MALTVNTNTAALNALTNYQHTNRALNSSFQKISSGLRITKAADDAAGLAVAENLDAQSQSLRQAKRNTNDGNDGGGLDLSVPKESGIPRGNVEMILNIPVHVQVEIGRTKLPVGEILNLCQGSVVELDHLASDMIDLTVNNRVVAHGEAVVINENFGLRVLEVESVVERIRKL